MLTRTKDMVRGHNMMYAAAREDTPHEKINLVNRDFTNYIDYLVKDIAASLDSHPNLWSPLSQWAHRAVTLDRPFLDDNHDLPKNSIKPSITKQPVTVPTTSTKTRVNVCDIQPDEATCPESKSTTTTSPPSPPNLGSIHAMLHHSYVHRLTTSS